MNELKQEFTFVLEQRRALNLLVIYVGFLLKAQSLCFKKFQSTRNCEAQINEHKRDEAKKTLFQRDLTFLR